MKSYVEQPQPITITGLHTMDTCCSLPPNKPAITLVLANEHPWSFRFKNPRCVFEHRSFNRLYVGFRYQSEIAIDQPITFQYQRGLFSRCNATHSVATPGLNTTMTKQLGQYLDNMIRDVTVDYARFEHLLCLLTSCLLDADRELPPPSSNGLTPRQLQTVKEYVARSLDQPFQLQVIAEQLALSKYHFCRTFKACTGESPRAYVTQQKMQRARTLILQTDLSIIQVTYEVGYRNPGHFATAFRKAFGQTPSQWRSQVKTASLAQ